MKQPPKPNFGKTTNLYTLHVFPNNTYDVLFNGESYNLGSLLEDFNPPVNPEKEIDDPDDKKPEDWVDEKRIPDPEAVKVSDFVYGMETSDVNACIVARRLGRGCSLRDPR